MFLPFPIGSCPFYYKYKLLKKKGLTEISGGGGYNKMDIYKFVREKNGNHCDGTK